MGMIVFLVQIDTERDHKPFDAAKCRTDGKSGGGVGYIVRPEAVMLSQLVTAFKLVDKNGAKTSSAVAA